MHSSSMRTAAVYCTGGVSVQEGLCPEGLCPGGSLSRGSLSRGLCEDTPSPSVDRQTPVKILPCSKLRLRTVIN